MVSFTGLDGADLLLQRGDARDAVGRADGDDRRHCDGEEGCLEPARHGGCHVTPDLTPRIPHIPTGDRVGPRGPAARDHDPARAARARGAEAGDAAEGGGVQGAAGRARVQSAERARKEQQHLISSISVIRFEQGFSGIQAIECKAFPVLEYW